MPDILVRGLPVEAISRLKRRAKRNGRSLQSEAKLLLEQAAGDGADSVSSILAKWHARLAGRKLRGSAALIRADRRR